MKSTATMQNDAPLSTPSTPRNAPTSPQPAPHRYSSLAIFTPDQLTQISNWLQTHTYKQTSQLIHEHFHQS